VESPVIKKARLEGMYYALQGYLPVQYLYKEAANQQGKMLAIRKIEMHHFPVQHESYS
jgi:hypothetical protein